jgi:methionyl-tRNA formyltransferase
MRLIFAGTPEFARIALAALHAAGHEIILVLTQPDRPAGRGMQLQASAVKQFALAHHIAVAQPHSLRLDGKYPEEAAAAQTLLNSTPHDAMIVAAYGLILPQWVLDLPRLGCINIHASRLPRWRGAAPIHRAIEAGDAETGITIMRMEAGLDTGPMLLTQTIAIAPVDTTATLHDKLADLGGELIVKVLPELEHGALVAQAQPDAGVSYAAKISKDEAALDFNQSAQVLANKIRAFDPFPGCTAKRGDALIKIWRAVAVTVTEATRTKVAAPGEIIAVESDGILVATGHGLLKLTELQKPGGKRLPATAFLKGFELNIGDRFAL